MNCQLKSLNKLSESVTPAVDIYQVPEITNIKYGNNKINKKINNKSVDSKKEEEIESINDKNKRNNLQNLKE